MNIITTKTDDPQAVSNQIQAHNLQEIIDLSKCFVFLLITANAKETAINLIGVPFVLTLDIMQEITNIDLLYKMFPNARYDGSLVVG